VLLRLFNLESGRESWEFWCPSDPDKKALARDWEVELYAAAIGITDTAMLIGPLPDWRRAETTAEYPESCSRA
jgi:hypothetical protein